MSTPFDPTLAPIDALPEAPEGLPRRGLLQLALTGGALATLSPLAWAQAGAPKRGGTLTIGADADPIGLDPVTLTAFSSYDFTACSTAACCAGMPR
jgi:peptide/nickel transport system substrate-binding protein